MDKQTEILLDDSDDEFCHEMKLSKAKAKGKGSKKNGGKIKSKGEVTVIEPPSRSLSLRGKSSSTTKSDKKDMITINEENVKSILSKVINKSDPSHSPPLRSVSLRGKENEENMKRPTAGRITRGYIF